MEIGFWSDGVVPEPSDAAADATVLRYLRGDFRRATAVRSIELGPSWCRLGCFDGVCHHEMGAATLCSAAQRIAHNGAALRGAARRQDCVRQAPLR